MGTHSRQRPRSRSRDGPSSRSQEQLVLCSFLFDQAAPAPFEILEMGVGEHMLDSVGAEPAWVGDDVFVFVRLGLRWRWRLRPRFRLRLRVFIFRMRFITVRAMVVLMRVMRLIARTMKQVGSRSLDQVRDG